MGDVDLELLDDVRREALDLDRTQRLLEHAAADLDANRFANEVERNRHAHLLRERNLAEIHVDGSTRQDVVLHLTQKRRNLGTVHVQRNQQLLATAATHRHHELMGVELDELRSTLVHAHHRRGNHARAAKTADCTRALFGTDFRLDLDLIHSSSLV